MSNNPNLHPLRQLVDERIAAREAEIINLRKLRDDFDHAFAQPISHTPNGESAPKRRGPKPGFKRAPRTAQAQATTPKVSKPRGRPAKVREEATTNAVAGRREVLDSKRPKLKEAITRILKDKIMDATMIYEKLNAKGWLPNSGDPRLYISQFLSSHKDDFDKVPSKRGFYRVAAAKTTEAANPPAPVSDTDATLAEIGLVPPPAN